MDRNEIDRYIYRMRFSENTPHILTTVTELGTCHRRRQRIVGKTDLLVHKLVGKTVLPSGHSPDKHTYALVVVQGLDVVLDALDLGVER